ncbi:MAG: hypothetical protein ACRDPM_20150 [Solirubrobacteraceae bacterium]
MSQSSSHAPAQRPTGDLGSFAAYHLTYGVELYDHGPEPDWHEDRSLYSAWWGRYELRCINPAGALLASARGPSYKEAWSRLAQELAKVMHWTCDGSSEERRS